MPSHVYVSLMQQRNPSLANKSKTDLQQNYFSKYDEHAGHGSKAVCAQTAASSSQQNEFNNIPLFILGMLSAPCCSKNHAQVLPGKRVTTSQAHTDTQTGKGSTWQYKVQAVSACPSTCTARRQTTDTDTLS